ncbi:MAG: PilZ domain-containing protein [Gammaproteobacteria bacterium]|nr:PilZ domain-containing protein [Gammaproteobacteria bacterium]MDH3447340.1 PilZ domain-containing protein [Gammaproteobacteria bacterium]
MDRERRRYFRIDDDVLLTFSSIDAAELDARLENFWSNEHEYSIRNNYNFRIEQHIADRHKIQAKMPELARYLSVLEKQIDLITDKLIADDDEKSMTRMRSNLSAQGISFVSDQNPQNDEMVELKLKLLPSGLRLVIIARVVLVEQEPGQVPGQTRISLDFEHLHEADREILVKHIHGKQMEALSSAQES